MPTCPSCGTENPAGFLFCGRCRSPLTEAAPERRKTVTVLFCDVSGSTQLGERLDPETLRAVMARYFSSMRSAIERQPNRRYTTWWCCVGKPSERAADVIVQRGAVEVPIEDAEVSAQLARNLSRRGIQIKTGVKVSADGTVAHSYRTGSVGKAAALYP